MQKRASPLCSIVGTVVMKYFSLSDAVMVIVPPVTSSRKQSKIGIEFLLAITLLAAVRRP